MTDEMIKTFEPLIRSLTKKFYGIEEEDLYQVGVIGLMNAYKHYNKEANTKFSTFAYSYIFGEMYSLAMNLSTIKKSKENLKLFKLAEKTKLLLTQEYGKVPTLQEISLYLEIPENKIAMAYQESEKILSLDSQTEETTNLYNKVGLVENIDSKIDLKDSIGLLDEEAKKIIEMRYYKDCTQQEIADTLGISQVNVSRVEARSLKKLKNYLTE